MALTQLIGLGLPAILVITLLHQDCAILKVWQNRPSGSTIAFVVLISTLISLGLNGASYYWQHFFPPSGPGVEWLTGIGQELTEPTAYGYYFVVLCVIPALSEEVFFRGFIQIGLSRSAVSPSLGRQSWLALIITSLIFALAHLQWDYFPFFFLLGLYLGWLMQWRHHLLLPILAHATHNAVGLLILILV